MTSATERLFEELKLGDYPVAGIEDVHSHLIDMAVAAIGEDLAKFGTEEEKWLYETEYLARFKLDGQYDDEYDKIFLDNSLEKEYGSGAVEGTYAHERTHKLFDNILMEFGYKRGSPEMEELVEEITGDVLSVLTFNQYENVRERAEKGMDFWKNRQKRLREAEDKTYDSETSCQAAAPAGGGAAPAAATPKWSGKLYKGAVGATFKLAGYAPYMPLEFLDNLLSMGKSGNYGMAKGWATWMKEVGDFFKQLAD